MSSWATIEKCVGKYLMTGGPMDKIKIEIAVALAALAVIPVVVNRILTNLPKDAQKLSAAMVIDKSVRYVHGQEYYHRGKCEHLKGSPWQTTPEGAGKLGYRPCPHCCSNTKEKK